MAADAPGKQCHTLVLRGGSPQRRQAKGQKVVRLDQLGSNRSAVVRGIGRIECSARFTLEFDEASILDTVRLRFGNREKSPAR